MAGVASVALVASALATSGVAAVAAADPTTTTPATPAPTQQPGTSGEAQPGTTDDPGGNTDASPAPQSDEQPGTESPSNPQTAPSGPQAQPPSSAPETATPNDDPQPPNSAPPAETGPVVPPQTGIAHGQPTPPPPPPNQFVVRVPESAALPQGVTYVVNNTGDVSYDMTIGATPLRGGWTAAQAQAPINALGPVAPQARQILNSVTRDLSSAASRAVPGLQVEWPQDHHQRKPGHRQR